MAIYDDGRFKIVTEDSLSNIQIFKSLSLPTRRCIAQNAVAVEYLAGVDLYRQSDPPTGLFALQAGRVKLYRQSKKKCQILALPMPGDCFGAESLPTGAPSPYSATTLMPVVIVHLRHDCLQHLLDEHTDFRDVFLQLIIDRLKQFVTLVHDLAFRDVTSRLATVLSLRAEVEGLPHHEGIIYDRLLSQQEFADMVGTAREVVYRTFKKFEADGLVQMTRSSILVYDLDTLRAIALQEAH
ncbi:MAG: Crp/Fnr family transcriptional regulator [Anaerolineae bacterium]|nr:Crp/Fnr family transcriptional regulator [Anaerolineae bacterium]